MSRFPAMVTQAHDASSSLSEDTLCGRAEAGPLKGATAHAVQADQTQADQTQADQTQADQTQADQTQVDQPNTGDPTARYRALEAQVPGMIYQFAMKPDGMVSFPYVSAGSWDVYGLAPEAIQTDPTLIIDIIHPEDRPSFDASVARSAERLTPWHWTGRVELAGLSAHTGLRWLKCTSRPQPQPGGSVLWSGIVVDITERKVAEEQLRDALERERELGQLKSRFVSMVSHELRAPLAVIQTSAELARVFATRGEAARRDEHLARIEASVQRMTELVDDVLQYGRAEDGCLTYSSEPVDVAALLRRRIACLREGTGAGRAVEAEGLGQPLPVQADPKLLRLIFDNLLSNAVKYSPEGQPVHVCAAQMGSELKITVADEGIGIPAGEQALVFEPFHRASNADRASGTGLGLAIARRAARRHGGDITVESQPGQGTRFTVALPTGHSGPEPKADGTA